MPKPGEHKTVQARIIKYAEDIGWTIILRPEAEAMRKFNATAELAEFKARSGSLFFNDLLYQKVLEFNPLYKEEKGELVKMFHRLKADIHGNQEFLHHLRNEGKFFYSAENRELDLKLIDYDDFSNNVYHITEEFYWHNGRFGNREDVVLLINGIPVFVIECKNANKDEGVAIGIDQMRRYHNETPEFFIPEMVFAATDAMGLSYGATWNTVRRNIFAWKHEQVGQLEAKIKTFIEIDQLLATLKDYILFSEQDEELRKFILKQHQTAAVSKAVERALDKVKTRGLVWHTQGSGKTFTMLKTAQMLFKAQEAEKPTILLLIDRKELQDQLLKNLGALGMNNVNHAHRIDKLNQLLQDDTRGIIVSTIHKFRGMQEIINERKNIYLLIDEAHRTTGGDLGNFLMAALPNATYIGFTGTPIDRTAYGQGTFKTFGVDDADEGGYLHKYSIQESIEDGTTLPLYYNMAPNDMLVPTKQMEKEFYALAETEGISDIDELNKILDRAVNLKNFLKGKDRIEKVAKYVAEHYQQNVEPMGYKAFLVAVDREACAKYKKALDRYLPVDYSEVVFTGNNNDSLLLKEFHIDDKKEKNIRKAFTRISEKPKILIVTEKLLTGFDAPILYAMYLDKPMRDHTLLQAIARVNRPYENEAEQMVKPHGFVLDFVGIFGNLKKALAFDSKEVNAIIKDLNLLKNLFVTKMMKIAPEYIKLIQRNFDDKDVDGLIEHFKDKDTRKQFFKEYKETQMLYEIISPDKFMRPYINEFATFSAIYSIVRKAFTKQVYVDRDFQKKTNALVQEHIDTDKIQNITQFVEINSETVELIKKGEGGKNKKVVNLIASIQKIAEDNSDDPFLVGMAERALLIQESFESRQSNTSDTLEDLITIIVENDERKRKQAEKGFDAITYYVFTILLDAGVSEPGKVVEKIKAAFVEHPNWKTSENDLREVRTKMTIAIFSKEEDLEKVTSIVDEIFTKLNTD
jgi:type I restriction enzyme, R subunit